ncbi:murein L,D-transpeptidase YcbB/YkuD [Pseudochelatococcus contaminans]|uniref:Murein L,D-transpeptidase YcbB/YkuD n=1 Tax=Pseudochelatococcus contaminans TaxID=1538103 RepID=A0A7W5Z6D7_9HYPH|nr:murein L,D-transpeptidase YcbB/YkuD [Pseudochelatococcus contaminans]
MKFQFASLSAAVAGSIALVGSAFYTPAAAQQQLAFGQAEWQQNYDSAQRGTQTRSNTPTLSPDAVAATEQAVARYRSLAESGGWGKIGNDRLRLGSRGPAVQVLRQRLVLSGDLDASAARGEVFDSYVEAGLRKAQLRYGLAPTGVVNPGTVAALNVPAEVRVRQLEVNLVRLRSYSGNLGNRYVIVNIPAASVETVANNHVVTRHAAGVGKVDRQSPIFNSRITEINFNPFWTVPASIIRKDLIPKMRQDPKYLTDQKIRIYNAEGQEIQPSQVDWNTYEATRYRFRQDPGADLNSMGFVRINIPNPYGVYMHDTPAKGVFGDDFRFVSSGCVRMQNVRDYIAFLLEESPGWDRQKIQAAIDSGKRIDAPVSNPVPVFWTYITAWATPDGVVQFRSDIYDRDGLGLGGQIAALEANDSDASKH